MAYNSAWAAELGFEGPPISVEDFKEQACAANAFYKKDGDTLNDGLGGWLIDTGSDTFYSWLSSFGANPFLNGQYRFSDEAAINTLNYLFDLKAKSCAWSGTSPQVEPYFANRQALFYSGSLADIPTQVMAQTRSGSSDTWSIIRYPALQGDPIFLTHGSSYSILSANPQEQLASWLLVSWLVQPEQQSALLKTEIGLPVSTASAVMTKSLIDQYPQWAQSVDWMPLSDTLPQSAEWRRVSPMMEDAVWQLYQHTTLRENLADILSMLDQTILETREHTPQD